MTEVSAAHEARDALLYVTDIHFWRIVWNPFLLLNKRFLGNLNVMLRRRHEFRQGRAPAFSDALQAAGVPTVLLGGDFTSTAHEGEFQDAAAFARGLASRGLRVLVMPGNHDVYTFGAKRRRLFETHFAEFAGERELPARVDLPGGTPLILTPTVCPNLISSRGRIALREIVRTAELVRAAPPGPVMVSGHYPMLARTSAYRTGWSRSLRNAEGLRQALGETGREILYLAGHVHRFSYVRDRDWPNLRHCTTPAFFLERPGEEARGAFSEFAVADGGFRVYRHTFGETWTRAEAQAEVLPE